MGQYERLTEPANGPSGQQSTNDPRQPTESRGDASLELLILFDSEIGREGPFGLVRFNLLLDPTDEKLDQRRRSRDRCQMSGWDINLEFIHGLDDDLSASLSNNDDGSIDDNDNSHSEPPVRPLP